MSATDQAGNTDEVPATWAWTVAPAAPDPGPGEQPGGSPAGVVPLLGAPPATALLDSTPPVLNVLAKAAKGRRVTIEFVCPTEACRASVGGRLVVPGAARTFSLRPATAQIQKGKRARLAPRLTSKAWRMARRALRAGRTVRVRIDLTVTDTAGNATTARHTIRLRG